MKQNAEETPIVDADPGQSLHVVEAPRQGGGAKVITLPSANRGRLRPEIAVLGWTARSYRLALRQGKV